MMTVTNGNIHMAISKAESDLARAQADVRRLEAQLLEARERATKIAHYIEIAKIYEAGVSPSPETRRGGGGRSAEAARLTADILRERGEPMHTRQILAELARRGFVIDSLNPVTNLSSALSRSDELKSDRSMGWSLAEWQTEEKPIAEITLDDIFGDAPLRRVVPNEDDIPSDDEIPF
jgi:hypothetical protein